MKLAYYPGCSLRGTAFEYDRSVQAACADLDVELVELPDWNCCGASPAATLDHDLAISLPARNLAQGARMGLDIFAPCAACYNRLKTAQWEVRETGRLPERAAEVVGDADITSVRVLNVLQFFVDIVGLEQIEQHVKRPLSGLRPAAYYGCLLLRPPEVCQFDDPEQPQTMERVLQASGAEPVTWYTKTDCCGAAMAAARQDIAEALCTRIAYRARQAGANCLVVACPLCHVNLDSRQSGDAERLPVLYISQAYGLAAGRSWQELGINKHLVSARSLLAEANLVAA